MQTQYVVADDTLLMSQCDTMHIDRLKYVKAYVNNVSRKLVCFEGEVVGDTIEYSYGDSLCKRIIAFFDRGQEEIIPCLLEKIKDTTIIRREWYHNYTVADIAIDVLSKITKKWYNFDAWDFAEREFGEIPVSMNFDFSNVFKHHTPRENHRRRIIFYNAIKKHIEDNPIH